MASRPAVTKLSSDGVVRWNEISVLLHVGLACLFEALHPAHGGPCCSGIDDPLNRIQHSHQTANLEERKPNCHARAFPANRDFSNLGNQSFDVCLSQNEQRRRLIVVRVRLHDVS